MKSIAEIEAENTKLRQWIENIDKMWGGMIFIRNGKQTTLREVLEIDKALTS